jgi:ABC-type nitrate/sulfonate/bicarbonate transport system permease component
MLLSSLKVAVGGERMRVQAAEGYAQDGRLGLLVSREPGWYGTMGVVLILLVFTGIFFLLVRFVLRLGRARRERRRREKESGSEPPFVYRKKPGDGIEKKRLK